MSGPDLSNYNEVADRMAEFFNKYPTGSFQTVEIRMFTTSDGHDFVGYVAAAFRTPDDIRPGHGTAWEPVPGTTNFTRNSELMNAETSAWGRAIVAVGASTAKKIASTDEVRNRQAENIPVFLADQTADLATEKQVKAIFAIARSKNLTGIVEARKILNRHVETLDSLTKREAGKVIDGLNKEDTDD